MFWSLPGHSNTFMRQIASLSFSILLQPSHSSLIQNPHDSLISLGPWLKPPPSSLLLSLSQAFCRFVYWHLKHASPSTSDRWLTAIIVIVTTVKVRSYSKTRCQRLGSSLGWGPRELGPPPQRCFCSSHAATHSSLFSTMSKHTRCLVKGGDETGFHILL